METLQFRTDAFKKELEYEEYFTVHRQAKLKINRNRHMSAYLIHRFDILHYIYFEL